MECQECHERPATLHFTQVINGEKAEVYVCEVCAKEKEYMNYPEEGYSLHHLLSGLLHSTFENPKSTTGQQVKEVQCPKCEMTLSEFKRVGKFGCPACYETFADNLDPIFRRVHSGNTKHYGKIPARIGGDMRVKKQVDAYKEELQRLIKNEAFEEAATVRDKIKELEKQTRGDDS
ncbi:protein-arginine kinase activator protein [Lentibacillus kapialis]|uniref:Protein-arginine kinase activator protein n=1 Tax=Lentibacillus kapialis TaxID=340214 RepID=A0A917PVR2_9BACI|nr:UvrB/UvrC motif-containing protein [Lentibacillus kapialis]GGJ93357.1 protein-arginine kinase activator protein [Lentibacillus kapialis]